MSTAEDRTSREAMRAFREKLAEGAGGVFHFPIRHHSPACALHLGRALDELKPRCLVIEMPADFASLVPLVLDSATRPPVAIVSVVEPKGKADAASVMGYWPLSASAPEWVALRWAGEHGARIVLADLPTAQRVPASAAGQDDPGEADENDEEGEEGDGPAPAKAAPNAPVVLTDEQPIAYSDYAQALVARLGARDFNEAWDRLFESRAAETDWRAFFGDVGMHCALSRKTASDSELESDGTLAREIHMRRALAEAVAAAEGGPVAVVTGGFHTPALLDGGKSEKPPTARKEPGAKAYLVRYAHTHLDRLNGYASGMPSPRYYERLHGAVVEGASDPHLAVAEDVLLGLAARLRKERAALAPALPTLIAALNQAQGLARLRDLAGPGRSEILDAARSCFVKDEDPRYGSPILELLHRELTGEAIGDVPLSAGSPPLVEAARAKARALGFKVDDGLERKRDLDIHRKARHRAASRFLHAMTLLETGYGRKVQGPDWGQGVNMAALFETWTCAWSPLVEGHLVTLAGDGDTVERACLSALRRRADALEEQGAGRDSSAVAGLVMLAAQAGVVEAGPDLLRRLTRAIALDPDFGRLVACLSTLDILWRGRAVLGLTGAADLKPLLAACYRRAIDLMPGIANGQGEKVQTDARALAGLHHLLETANTGEADTATLYDRELFDAGVAALLSPSLPPLVSGVVGALGHLAGRIDEAALAGIVCGALGGAVEAPEARSAPLAGLLMVQPALLRRCETLLDGIDAVLEDLDETRFLAMLPDLRLALAALDPHETDDLAERIAHRKGHAGPLLTGSAEVSLEEAIANAERSQALMRVLGEDGLEDWLGA